MAKTVWPAGLSPLQGSLNLRAAFTRRIYLGLAEYHGDALLEQFIGNALDIVAINKAQTVSAFTPKIVCSSCKSCPASTSKPGFFST